MATQNPRRTAPKESTAGLMDRHLNGGRDTTGDGCHYQTKLGSGAFMKGVSLHRTPEGNIVATAPVKALAHDGTRSEAREHHAKAMDGSTSFFKNYNQPAYVVHGDTWALHIGGECDVWLDTYSEAEACMSFDASPLYKTENGHCYRGTPDSGRTTPELCWSSASSVADSVEEMEAEEGVLEMMFHQLIDVAQCGDF